MTHILLLASFAPSLLNFRGPLIRDLLEAGHRVSVGAPEVPLDVRAMLESWGVAVHDTPLERTGTGLLGDLRYCCGLAGLLKRTRPDLLLTYTIKPNIWGAFAAARAGVPSFAMVTGLGYAFTETGERPSLKRRLTGLIARKLYRAATGRNRRVIFQNPDDRDDFVASGCLADPGKVAMVNGSGVDMVHYARAPLPDSPVVLMIARLLGNKGVRDYVMAARQLQHSHPKARFVLVGPSDDGPDSIRPDELQQWIAEGLDYRGGTEDVRPFLAGARIYVLPSYREGTPRSVLEAMAMGRPVITTDVPGCRETVEPGVNGLLVPVRDPQALAQAIARLLDNPDKAARMGEAGFALVARKYDVHQVNHEIMQILGLTPEQQNRDPEGQHL